MTMLKTREEIEVWLDTHNVKNYVVNEDLTVDVKGSVLLQSVELRWKLILSK